MVPFWTEWASSARTTSPGGLAVGEGSQDREQVVVGEAPGLGRESEGLVDLVVAQDGGQLDRAGHLGADTDRAGGSGLLEPAPGSGADAHERDLRFRAGPQPRLVDRSEEHTSE